MFDYQLDGKRDYFRLAWRILTFISLIITLYYFVPSIAYQSVMHLPLSPQWSYILALCVLSFLLIIIDGYLALGSIYWMILTWMLTICWLVGFGIFAQIYMGRGSGKGERYKGTNTAKMQTGTWVLFASTVWWALYAVWCTLAWWKKRRGERAGGYA